MMMDFFFEHASIEKKKRYHFHSFLAQVHTQIHELKQQDLKENQGLSERATLNTSP